MNVAARSVSSCITDTGRQREHQADMDIWRQGQTVTEYEVPSGLARVRSLGIKALNIFNAVRSRLSLGIETLCVFNTHARKCSVYCYTVAEIF